MTLVIGIGNALRGDDGVGWRVVERLDAGGVAGGVETLAVHQLNPEHAEIVSEAARVVFVDASVQTPPGCVASACVVPGGEEIAPSHSLTPAHLLALTRAIYGAAPEAFLVTVGGADFGLRESLSPPVAAALDEAVAAVAALIPRAT